MEVSESTAGARSSIPFGLTTYLKARMVGSYVYPRGKRTAGTAPRHAGPAHLAHAGIRPAARARHRAGHSTNIGRCAARGTRSALSRPPAAGSARVDCRSLGHFGK